MQVIGDDDEADQTSRSRCRGRPISLFGSIASKCLDLPIFVLSRLGLSASTGLFGEGSCGATGSTQGVAYYPTQTVKSTGGSGCRVSAQIGIWNGGGVTWEREDVDPTLAAVGSIYQPYMTRHGVD